MPRKVKTPQIDPFTTPPELGVVGDEFKAGMAAARAMDVFQNIPARMGHRTPSLGQGTTYEMTRISLNYWLMLTMYRNHWIARRIVETVAQDMVRTLPQITGDIPPEDIKQFNAFLEKSSSRAQILRTLKWARLYGGAGALIVIDGHENKLDEPLDVEEVVPGSFLGLIPFDRWVGISPDGDICYDLNRPDDYGLPEYYTITAEDTTSSGRVHASRIMRFVGPEVPIPENQAMTWWGISVLEVVFDEIKKRDNASWAMLALMFRANIIAQKNPQLAQMLSGVGMSGKALTQFYQIMEAQNQLLGNQSMLILPENGGLESVQYNFSGLDGIYQQFQMDLAGAVGIPVTRLFGRTMTGLGQTNDADERLYEETIAALQHDQLRPQLMKLYPIVAMSLWGEVPDEWDIRFPSLRVLTEEEKADLVVKVSTPLIEAYNAGGITQKIYLQELQQLSQTTNVFTNVTDEMIDAADDTFGPTPAEQNKQMVEQQKEAASLEPAQSDPASQLKRTTHAETEPEV